MNNPNLNELLDTDEELYNHAWLQVPNLNHLLVICLEPYDRMLSRAEAIRLHKLIRNSESEIINIVNMKYRTKHDCIEIENYL